MIARRLFPLLLAVLLLAPLHPVAAAHSLSIFVEPGAGSRPVLNLIRSARHSIRLEVYILSNRAVISALETAHRQGIDVRVLLEERPYGAESEAESAYNSLHSAGVSVRWANESAFTYTHEKAMVVDGSIAGIFTLNLSTSAFYGNREFGLIDRNPADAAALTVVFNADWNRRPVSVHDPALVLSPVNSRADLDTLIDSAHHTLDLYQEEVQDVGVEGHLERSAARGVRVRLITSAGSAGVDALRRAHIQVRIVAKPYIHAKAIVADGISSFIGSENISTTSLDHNREVGLLTRDPVIAARIEHTFAQDWTGAAPSPPPSPPTSSGSFSVRVSTSSHSVHRGQHLTISAVTKPGATCRVTVTYPDGYVSRARALQETPTAGSDGRVTWSWEEGSTKTGTGRASVSCSLGAREASGSATFQIV